MKHNEGKFTGAGGLELYYQRWQPDGQPRAALAIVHGIGEHSGRYMNVVNQIVPHGYSVYGFDLRGHGRSAGQRGYIGGWQDYREDVRAFVRMVGEQAAGRAIFIMGHSLGGLITLEYVLQYPDGLKGVIASAPALGQTGVPPLLIAISRILSRVWPTFSLKTQLDASGISRDPAVVRAYVEDPLVHSLGTARLGAEAPTAMAWTQAHAADLRLPLLIVHGSADRVVPPEASRIFFENASSTDKTRLVYEGGYHESHNDLHHVQALTDLEQWLERHL